MKKSALPVGIKLSEVPRKKFRSQLEADFANHLEYHKSMGTISLWLHEPFKVRLAEGVWFLPDFFVLRDNCLPAFYEVKGEYSRRLGEVKFKTAAEHNDWADWFWVTRRADGAWEIKCYQAGKALPKKKKH